MTSQAKAVIKTSVENFLKKEIKTQTHTDDRLAKMKSVLKYLHDDDVFCIVDPENSIKCVFDDSQYLLALEKKGGKKENLDSKYFLVTLI